MSYFKWELKGSTFSFDLNSYSRRRKNWTFLDAKILPRFACRLSGSSSSRFSAPERGSEVGFVKF